MNETLQTAIAPALFSPDGLAGVVFLIMVALTLFGALVAASTERLVRAVAGLALCFVGVAAIYFFLNAPFVSMMQILIYVGAVCVTISFAIMLAAPEKKKKFGPSSHLAGPLGAFTSIILATALIILGLQTDWKSHPKENLGDVELIGIQLLTDFSMVFELVSILLLIAILGSLVIARGGREQR